MNTLLKNASEINILVVDDTADNLRLLSKILDSQGYTIRKSLNGRMALQAAHREAPDLILLDINMPEMNGYEVCKQLKASEITSNIPIIFISALDQTNDKILAFELGGQDYITKPFQELEVLVRVKNQLLIKQQYDQLVLQNQRLEQEIQERLKAEAEIRQLSLTDELTGLYNRRGFFFLANQQIKIAKRREILFYIVFIDLDCLKQVNDSLGHEIGDKMIVSTAQILNQTFRDSDIIARLGGDEFVLFISSNSSDTDEINLRLKANIDDFNKNNRHCYQLSVSIGIRQFSDKENVSLEQLLHEADQLMFQDKKTKKAVRN